MNWLWWLWWDGIELSLIQSFFLQHFLHRRDLFLIGAENLSFRFRVRRLRRRRRRRFGGGRIGLRVYGNAEQNSRQQSK